MSKLFTLFDGSGTQSLTSTSGAIVECNETVCQDFVYTKATTGKAVLKGSAGYFRVKANVTGASDTAATVTLEAYKGSTVIASSVVEWITATLNSDYTISVEALVFLTIDDEISFKMKSSSNATFTFSGIQTIIDRV